MTHEHEYDDDWGMPALRRDAAPGDDPARLGVVHVHAAAFYVSCLKAGFLEEATEFAEWYLDTFDHDLES